MKAKSLVMAIAVAMGSMLYIPAQANSNELMKKSNLEEMVVEHPDVEFVRSLDLERLEEYRKSIRYVKFKDFDKPKTSRKNVIPAELEQIVELTDRIYASSEMSHNAKLNNKISDEKKFKKMIDNTSKLLGYRKRNTWDKRGFIRWETALVRYWSKYALPRNFKKEREIDSANLDTLLEKSKSQEGKLRLICRGYSTLLQQVHNYTRDYNERVRNICCARVRNGDHMWNLYIMETEEGPVATSVDSTWDDGPIFGKYTLMDHTTSIHKAWFRNKGFIYLYAGELLLSHGKYEEALEIYNKYVSKYSESSRVKLLFKENLSEYKMNNREKSG